MTPACADEDTNIWFEQEPEYDPQLAKLICAGCPVRSDCLTIHMREPHGIFGGLTEQERRRLRRSGRAS